MKKRTVLTLYSLLSFWTSISIADAANESFTDQFLSGPLLILAAILVVDIIAFVYHKIRK